MPLPVNGFVQPVTLIDPATGLPVVITASVSGVTPGTTVTSAANTAVAPGATVALPVVPAGTRRMTIQIVGGNASSRVRVREAGGAAGTGILLALLGEQVYGGADGALANMEVQNVAGPAASVAVQFEGN